MDARQGDHEGIVSARRVTTPGNGGLRHCLKETAMMKLTLAVWALLVFACLLVMQIFYLVHWEEIEMVLMLAEIGF